MSLRRVSCVDIYSISCRFSLYHRLWLRGLLLLILYAVILIVFGSQFSGNHAVEGDKFGFELLQLVLLAPRL